jgi:hypothetical protein
MTEVPKRLYPGDRELQTLAEKRVPYLDDDWFRFYGTEPGTEWGTVYYEVHELCGRQCSYREELCPWHPPGCQCSLGACQET